MKDDKRKNSGIASKPAVVTARRAFGITRTYIAVAIFFTILATVAWNPGNYISSSSSSNSTQANSLSNGTALLGRAASSGTNHRIVFLSVPLYVIPFLMLATPVIVLFVYDKNNGVLEYLLSLGMTQKEIYKRYLKAALFLCLILIAVFIPLNMLYSRIIYGPTIFSEIFPVYPISVLFSLSVVSFLCMCMMAFSSLQKSRAGSNQPLGMIIGWIATVPAYATPFISTYKTAIYADFVIIVIIAIVAITMLVRSNKFIRRENFLP